MPAEIPHAVRQEIDRWASSYDRQLRAGLNRYFGRHDDTARKSSEHSEPHVKPENAVPISGIPVADVVTRANVQHISWEMVREDKAATVLELVPLAAIIATQEVVDRQRVAKHEAELLAGEGTEPDQAPPLVLLWNGDYFLLGGHHGLQAAYNLGVQDVEVDVMVAPGP